MSKHVLDDNLDDVVYRYTVALEPMISIAAHYGCTRQAVYYALKRAGVDTSKQANGHIQSTCAHCGRPVMVPRCRHRANKRSFCNASCYCAWLDRMTLKGQPYVYKRGGMREAREKVNSVYALKDGYIVHHEDRNTTNNAWENLKVFANSGDHTRYHRGFRVPILWDGAEYARTHGK